MDTVTIYQKCIEASPHHIRYRMHRVSASPLCTLGARGSRFAATAHTTMPNGGVPTR